MEISLIRHGKSEWNEHMPITCQEFANWVEQYDYMGVVEELIYPLDSLEKIKKAKVIYTSHLKRAIQSATLLNPKANIVSDSLFRETELPIPSIKLQGLKLTPSKWTVILRCLWLFGYSSNEISYKNDKKRAEKAALFLVEAAMQYNSITLVGHGFLNILIAKELQKLGWKGKRTPYTKHWSCTTYFL